MIIQYWIIAEGRSILLAFENRIAEKNKKSLGKLIMSLEKENSGPDHNSFLEPNVSGVMDVKEFQREQFSRYNYLVEA